MPQSTTLSYVADLVIRRVLADLEPTEDLRNALEEAYPFDSTSEARRIWMDALLRNAVAAPPANTMHARQMFTP